VLELNPETVRFIVERSKEFQFEEGEAEVDATDVADDQPGDAHATIRAELESTIADLEPDQQIELVALMWLGRGDYRLDEWASAKRSAAASYNARTASYLIATPLLADYLEEGLALHGHVEA
jgi:uncharacterized protein DUF3775